MMWLNVAWVDNVNIKRHIIQVNAQVDLPFTKGSDNSQNHSFGLFLFSPNRKNLMVFKP